MGPETGPESPPEAGETRRERRRRKRRGRGPRAGLILLASVLVIGIGVPLLLLGVTGTPLAVPDWLATRIEERLNDRMGAGKVTLDRVELLVDRDMRPRVRMQNVGVFNEHGSELARLNEVRAHLSADKLLQGGVTLRALQVSGAQITVRRRANGDFDLSLGAGTGTSGDLAGVLDGLDRAFASEPLSELDSIQADALTITLEDSRSGRLWQVTEGTITLEHGADALDLTVRADVFNGTEELASTVIGFRTEKGSPQASLTATFENAAAADIAAQSPALAFLALLDAPISGALRASIDTRGEIETIAGTLELGQGALAPTPDTPPIRFDSARAYMSFDPLAETLHFTELSVQSDAATVTAEGSAHLQDFHNGWPRALVGQFRLSDAAFQPFDLLAEPKHFSDGAVDFRMRLDPFSVDIGQVALIDDEQRFLGRGRVRADQASWTAALDVELNTIPVDRLLTLWPVGVAPGTRVWLEKNVFSGRISELTGALRAQTGTEPEISLSYVFSDADVKVMKTLPPVRGGAGYASLSGRTFTMVVEEGVITAPQGGEIVVKGSVFSVPDVAADPGRADIRLLTDSSITGALSLLDLPPFTLMQKARQPVDVAEGRARMQARIGFDLLKEIALDDVSYEVEGNLLNMSSDKLVKARVVSAEQLALRADPTGVEIIGPARLGKVPVNVAWTQKFGPEHAGRSHVEGTAELSQAFLDEFRIGLPKGSVTGAGVGQISVELVRDQPPRFTLLSDLNRIGLRLDAVGWSKPRNQTGTLEVAGRLGDNPAIDRLILRAPGLSASGVVDLAENGALRSAQFDRVQVGGWLDGPVTLSGRGADRPPAVAMQGGNIDLREASFNTGGGDGAGNANGPLTLALDRLTVSEGITLTGFRGEFKPGAGLNGRFSARVNRGPPVEGTVVPTPSGAAIRLISPDAGGVIAAAGILRNARGGQMDLTLNPTGAEGTYNGRLRITRTRIVKAPALTDLLSAISIVGLLDQLNSGGISLSEVEAEFRLTPNQLVLYYSSAVGPSLGISLDGVYDLRSDRMDMQGVVSPVYFLNGIGQLFARGRDGLFGFNFRLTGDANDPRVAVNPLSILTPGAFREIFRRPPPKPVPSQ